MPTLPITPVSNGSWKLEHINMTLFHLISAAAAMRTELKQLNMFYNAPPAIQYIYNFQQILPRLCEIMRFQLIY